MATVSVAQEVTSARAWRVVHVAGELDVASAPVLRQLLAQAGTDPSSDVVVDLAAVTFMDCGGLLPLLEARTRLGAMLQLRNLSAPVAWLLELTGLGVTFSIVEGPSPRTGAVVTVVSPRRSLTDLQNPTHNGPVTEQARGLLMGTHRCDAEQAWRLLSHVAAEHHVAIRDLAAALLAAAGDPDRFPSDGPLTAATRVLLPPAVVADDQSAHQRGRALRIQN